MSTATDVGGIRATITADVSGYNQAVDRAKAKAAELGEAGKQASSSFSALNDRMNELSLSAEQINKINERLKRVNPKTLKGQLAEVRAELMRLGVSGKEIGKISKELEKAAKETEKQASSFSTLHTRMTELGASSGQIDKINERLKRANPQIVERQLAAVRAELTKLGVSSKEIDKISKELEKTAKSASVASQGIGRLGTAFVGLTVAMGAGITKAIQTSAQFEQSMAKVRAVTGSTTEEFEKLKKQSMELGSTTVFTASQAAEAQSYLAMAGFKTNQILAAMPGVLNLAAAGQMDLARASDIASNILTGFGLQAEKSNRVVDVMAKTMTSSNTNIEQLGYAMKYIAPVAASLGLSIEETAAAVGKLSDAGIQGEMAGTQLRAMLLRLTRPVGHAAEVMDKLGINIKNAATGGVLPLTQIVDQLERAFAKLTQAQQAEAASLIAGTEAASGFLTLIKTGSATLSAFTDELQHAGGAAQKMAETQMNTLDGSIKEMQSALEAVGITVGDKFAPALRVAVEGLTAALLGFNNLHPAVQTAIVAFIMITPLVFAAVTAFKALRLALIAVQVSVPPLLVISAVIGGVVAGISALVSANNQAAESARKFEQAQKSLHTTLSKSPMRRTVEDVEKLRQKEKELKGILEERATAEQELTKQIEIRKKANIQHAQHAQQLIKLEEKLKDNIEEYDKKLRNLGYKNLEAAEKGVRNLNHAVKESISALMEGKRAELEDAAAKQEKVSQMEQLSARYKELAALQSLDQAQKDELVQVIDALRRQYPELHRVMDAEERIRVKNIGLIDDQIGAERQYVNGLVAKNLQIVSVWETQARAQKASIDAQISNIESLLKAMDKAATAKPLFELPGGGFLKNSLKESIDQAREEKKKELGVAREESHKTQESLNTIVRIRNGLQGGDLRVFKGGGVSGAGIDLSRSKKKKDTKEKTGKKKEKSLVEIAKEQRKKAYEADIATTRFKSDMYDWNADQQIKEYEKVRGRHKRHLKETEEDNRTMLLQVKRLREDSAKSRYDFSTEWINKEERRMQDNVQSEVDISKMKINSWSRVRDKYKKGSDEYKKADEQVYQAKKQLVRAQYDFSSEWIEKETRHMEEAGKSEAELERFKRDSWTRIRDQYAKDSEFYKKADEQVYQAKRNLLSEQEKVIKEQEKLAKEIYQKQKTAVEDARKAELRAIEERKKAALDDYEARIKGLDALIAKETEFQADADYETKLSEKRARLGLLQSAVGPEGIKEREDIAKEIERMQLEHSRELRKRELESQKQAIQDEKSRRDEAFDREKSDVEAKYEALRTAFEDFSGDVKTIESAIAEFRVQSSAGTNTQILSDLDAFVREYNAKMAQVSSVETEPRPASSYNAEQRSHRQTASPYDVELGEYNANKDAWVKAKARKDTAEMVRLNARNHEIRRKYGMKKDTGKLLSFDVGGVVPGPVGHPLLSVVHGGEVIFNPRQLSRLFTMLNAPVSTVPYERPTPAPSSIVNHIDMSVTDVKLEDRADIQTLYSERGRASQRLQTMGVKEI